MNTAEKPLSPGTVPADYVPRVGDVFHKDGEPDLRVLRIMENRNTLIAEVDGEQMPFCIDQFAEGALQMPGCVTITRAPE